MPMSYTVGVFLAVPNGVARFTTAPAVAPTASTTIIAPTARRTATRPVAVGMLGKRPGVDAGRSTMRLKIIVLRPTLVESVRVAVAVLYNVGLRLGGFQPVEPMGLIHPKMGRSTAGQEQMKRSLTSGIDPLVMATGVKDPGISLDIILVRGEFLS